MSTEIDHSALVSSMAAAVRRHPVGAFLAWFFTVGQAIAFIPLIAKWITGTVLPTEPFLLAATAVGLVLPTITITWITDGLAGLRALRQRATRLWFPARWYAFAVLGVPCALVAIWATVAGPPEQLGGYGAATAFSAGFLLQLVVVFVTFNLWEELAWMGFVQARLQSRHGAIRAAVLTGPVFALGHSSQIIEGSVATTLVTLTLLVGVGLLERLYPGDGAGGLVFPVLGVLGLVAIAATRGRLGHHSTARPLGDREPVTT